MEMLISYVLQILKLKIKSPFETGLIDYNNLGYSIYSIFLKEKNFKREHFIYHGFKSFNNINFRMDPENKLEECPKHYENFEKTFVNLLHPHTSRKTEVLRCNHKPHVGQHLRKVIMKDTKLKNRAYRTNKMVLLNVRNDQIWYSSLIEIQNFVILII